MKYYKDKSNQVFAFESDGSQDHLIAEALVQMTAQEIDEHLAQVVAPPPKTQFTSLEFLDRFSEAEQLAVVTATMTNPVIKLWYDRLLAASFIDLVDPRTEEGIDALIAADLIATERKQQLLEPQAA